MDLSKISDKELIYLKNKLEGELTLENIKKNYDNLSEQDLVYATKTKENKLCEHCGGNCDTCENLVFAGQILTQPIAPQPQNNLLKIVCSHCGHNFDFMFTPGTTNQIKCPNCFSILDQTGKTIFPPQTKDFNVSCPECQASNNWLIEDSKDKEAKIKCLSCAKEYKITFKDTDANIQYISKLMFLRTGRVRCLQCSTYNEFIVPSGQKKIGVKCIKCGIQFDFDVTHDTKRDIEKIEKFIDTKDNKENIEEGNKKMFILHEAKILEEKEVEELDKDEVGYDLEEGKKLSYQQKKALSDSDFAVVVTVKNKITGEPRKIRKYPIQDEAHVRNALARLGQEAPQEELRKLGISPETVIKKVLARAKELGMTELLERRKAKTIEKSAVRKLLRKAVEKIHLIKSAMPSEVSDRVKELIKEGKKVTDAVKQAWDEYKTKTQAKHSKFVKGIKKFAGCVKELKKKTKEKDLENASLKSEVENTKKFYLEKATVIISRRNELGDFAKDLTDVVIADDKEYELIKAKKIVADNEKQVLETASTKVGDKTVGLGERQKVVNEIRAKQNAILNPKE